MRLLNNLFLTIFFTCLIVMDLSLIHIDVYKRQEWEGSKKDIIFSKNERLNSFIFASEFLQDAKDMRMLEMTGKIPSLRNMDDMMRKDGPSL